MVQRIQAGDDAAGAVAEQVRGQAAFVCLDDRGDVRDVVDVVVERVDVEAFAVGLAAAPQVQRVHHQIGGGELFGHPFVVAAVRIEAGDDDDGGAGRGGWAPAAHVE